VGVWAVCLAAIQVTTVVPEPGQVVGLSKHKATSSSLSRPTVSYCVFVAAFSAAVLP
jgi:hypothetical protein